VRVSNRRSGLCLAGLPSTTATVRYNRGGGRCQWQR
jgi:hypothetical protein